MELALRSLLLLLLYSLFIAVATFSVVAQNTTTTTTTAAPVTTPPVKTNQPNASIGDIMLTPGPDDDTSRVLIYYGNGVEAAAWGEICANDAHSLEKNIADVICKQYGRTGGDFVAIPKQDSATKIWLHNISCPQNVYHFLRCQHDVYLQPSSQNSCTQIVGVICSNDVLATIKGNYQGQVYLCPPNDFYSLHRSVSTGLVLLYFYDSWRTINLKTQSDTSDLLNSLCRQLGFTEAIPNSGVAQSASPYLFDHCYDESHSNAYAQDYAWLTTDQVDCKGSSRACSGCCYDYPQQQCSSPQECSSRDDLVVSCTFVASKRDQPPEGNPSLCAFSMDNQLPGTPLQSSVCAQEPREISLRTFEIVVGVLGPFALLGIVLTVGCLCCLCIIRYRRRNNFEHQPIVNHPPPHDDAGN